MLLSNYEKGKKLNNFTVVLFLLKSLKHFSLGYLSLEFKTCVQHCMGKFNKHTTHWFAFNSLQYAVLIAKNTYMTKKISKPFTWNQELELGQY